MNLGQHPINSFAVVPGIALNQTDNRQVDGHHGNADENQPVLQVSQVAAVQRFLGYFGEYEIETAQGGYAGESENADMGMSNHPIVKVGNSLDLRQRHETALKVGKKIHNGAGEHKLGTDVGVNIAQLAPHGVPDVDEEDHYWDDHGHAVHNGDNFQPGGYRHLQEVMCAHMGIDDDQRPETDQRKRVAVEGAACGQW